MIVATTTLELGIDVGDLDRVIQLGAPSSVASFLQRVGRTGRRAGTTRNMLILCPNPELSVVQTLGMLLRWGGGTSNRLPDRSTAPAPELAARLPELSEQLAVAVDGDLKFAEALPDDLVQSVLRARNTDPSAVRRVKSEPLNGAS